MVASMVLLLVELKALTMADNLESSMVAVLDGKLVVWLAVVMVVE